MSDRAKRSEAIEKTICIYCGGVCDEYYFEQYHWYRCTACGEFIDDTDAVEKIKAVRHTFDDGVYFNA